MGVVFGLLIGLQIKHYLADYFLQPGWMLAGKGDFFQIGGYAHAGLHAVLSLGILLVMGAPIGLAIAISAAEFVIHYVLDYAKVVYSRDVDIDSRPRRFWVLHGIDQLLHQLTYLVIVYLTARALGLA